MSDIPTAVAQYGIAAVLAFRFGPEIIRGILARKNGAGSSLQATNGVCKANEIMHPMLESHKEVLSRIEQNTKDTRDGIRDVAAALRGRRD